MDTRSVSLDRRQLSEFIKSPQTIKAFENLALNGDDYATVIGIIQSTPVISTALSDGFPDGRVITTDGEVQATDGGPGGNYTLGLSNTGVVAGSYGSAASTIRISVNAKGRISLVQSFPLNSDNVIEGVANLYFTQARARASISATAPIQYDGTTGVVSLGTVTVAFGGTGFTSYLAGDMIYAASSTALAKLAIGAANSVLTSNGSIPSWTASTGTGQIVRENAPTFTGPPILPSYTVAGVPSASPAGKMAYISNESGGAVPAFSDGTNWRRVTDRAIIS